MVSITGVVATSLNTLNPTTVLAVLGLLKLFQTTATVLSRQAIFGSTFSFTVLNGVSRSLT